MNTDEHGFWIVGDRKAHRADLELRMNQPIQSPDWCSSVIQTSDFNAAREDCRTSISRKDAQEAQNREVARPKKLLRILCLFAAKQVGLRASARASSSVVPNSRG